MGRGSGVAKKSGLRHLLRAEKDSGRCAWEDMGTSTRGGLPNSSQVTTRTKEGISGLEKEPGVGLGILSVAARSTLELFFRRLSGLQLDDLGL